MSVQIYSQVGTMHSHIPCDLMNDFFSPTSTDLIPNCRNKLMLANRGILGIMKRALHGQYIQYLNIDMCKNAEFIIEIPQNAEKIDYFSQVFNNNILEIIVAQSNLYESQNLFKKCNKTLDPSKNWENTPKGETRVPIGILVVSYAA